MSALSCPSKRVGHTYPEALASDDQEEDWKWGYNAENDKDGEDKEYHMG